MKKLAIIGAGGFGREVLWYLNEINKKSLIEQGNEKFIIEGFVDENRALHKKKINGVKVLGSLDWLTVNNDVSVVCAIANSRSKIAVIMFLESHGVRFETIIHPSAIVSDSVLIEQGSIIGPNVVITTQVEIKEHVSVHYNSTIGHDTVINSFSTIYPGVNISGNVRVGKGVELGTNSTILQGLKIGDGSFLGAGAVVNKSIKDNVVAVGIPAKTLRVISEKI